jgi:predicted aldo/keto reductase-like oxidoreductase
MSNKDISRRRFLKLLGAGTVATAATLTGCKKAADTAVEDSYEKQVEPPKGKMTYRTTPTTKDKVSLLGYGMMRLPTQESTDKSGEKKETIDQEQVNRLVDYAMEHGVNYFDTSPVYCMGLSEKATGIALHRHPRNSYFVATKMSNFDERVQSKAASIEMFNTSLRDLQVDYIDYYLLHSVGNGGMEFFSKRYLDNGVLDWLLEQRKAGKIRNLGFSYHGDVAVFDWLLANNDKYQWDFVQIQLNYVDWLHAKETNPRNTNAEYLYNELKKRNIPAIIMEPLLGGRLSKLPDHVVARLKQRRPEDSVASWAFRYAGHHDRVLTVLSGMTYMEHLQDNLCTFSPLVDLTPDDLDFLEETAKLIVSYPTVQCNDCKYCMPCPYGIDIPAIFVHYNKCVNEGNVPKDARDPNYAKARKAFLVGYDRAVAKVRQADHCIGCGQCAPHCPQNINIPEELHRIDGFIDRLKQGIL